MSTLKNSVQLIGKLAFDAQVKLSQQGVKYCQLKLVTAEKWIDKVDQPEDYLQWHNLSVWGGLCQILDKKGVKGSSWLVQGCLVNRQYTDKQGVSQKRTEVRVLKLMLLENEQLEELDAEKEDVASKKMLETES